ncbi:MAG: hypothetical protein JJE25_00375 [Bacteroidia bacterium]|nr:hypothetical protein [Bacteroidia bacterium]
MKRINMIALLMTAAVITLSSTTVFGGIKVKSGSLSKLKSEKTLKVEYDYSKMRVGKDLTEDQYVKQKVSEANAKSHGKGDAWKSSWINARADRYHPKFEELFNKVAKGHTISQTATDAKYTLIVKTVYTEPGWNVGVMKKPSYVNFVFKIVETADPTKVIAELTLDKVPGSQIMGGDFDAGSRISESYAKSGKMLGKFFADKIK